MEDHQSVDYVKKKDALNGLQKEVNVSNMGGSRAEHNVKKKDVQNGLSKKYSLSYRNVKKA
uniref:Uncharacterized protein n=1 Tax=Timema genevievae TaxID=629358 RepID=A0A7R9K8G9_TIMGE|nr:unnamed protein product [Timema genevievae]